MNSLKNEGIKIELENNSEKIEKINMNEEIYLNLEQENQTKTETEVQDEKTEMLLIPPLNFSMVSPGIYRSGYPNYKNFPFLKKIGIKTIIFLCPEGYLKKNQMFVDENNIVVKQFPIEGNKEPFVKKKYFIKKVIYFF
jgi:hypothetical protein